MIRTKTAIFCQRMRLELNALTQQVALMDRWNVEDDQDEVMLEAELAVISHTEKIIDEMKDIINREWDGLYTAKKSLVPVIEKEVAEHEPVQPGL